MTYHQLTSGERHALSALRKQGFSQADIARALGRNPSTVSRELRRNSDGNHWYRPAVADEMTRGRRSRSRRNRRFTGENWDLVCSLLRELWSPEQIAGRLALEGRLLISHETIYRYVWEDRRRGGTLHLCLRGARKQRWKRYRSHDSRGRLAGKRPITDRPPGAENRSRVGHLEGDTVLGASDRHCVLSLVDRKTGYLLLGKLSSRTTQATNRRAVSLINRAPRRTRTLTLDNGTEFHGYKDLETATGTTVFFAAPHHSWERGTCENTNGLIRQYLPKRRTMARITQSHCDQIASALNSRPRKRHAFLTPAELYEYQER